MNAAGWVICGLWFAAWVLDQFTIRSLRGQVAEWKALADGRDRYRDAYDRVMYPNRFSVLPDQAKHDPTE